jgi:hypothetical protein
MSIQDLGSLGELVGAVAVVLSLIYLATQIRQNTQATRAASYEDVAQGVRAFMALIANDEGVADIYLRGAATSDQLAPLEQVRFEMLLGHFFANFDMAVDLYRRRMIDDKMMIPYSRFAESLLAQAGVAEYWESSRHFFSDDLRTHIETLEGGSAP